MAPLILGISIGLFMYAFVNYRYTEEPWIRSKHVVVMGLLALGISLVLFFLSCRPIGV